MIISASRRTDIPAFYGKWFIRRLRAGYCKVANPFNPSYQKTISLRPEDVEGIVFWTRYPRSLIPYIEEIEERSFDFYFLFTVLDYPKLFEARLPPYAERRDLFRRLAKQLGPHRLIWRYDPILFTESIDFVYHAKTFARIAEDLRGSTKRVIVSLFDRYKKTESRLTELEKKGHRIIQPAGTITFLQDLASIARSCGMEIQSCADSDRFKGSTILPGSCIDGRLIEELTGKDIEKRKDPGQRGHCLCIESKDIGAYNSCSFGCRYCYANGSEELVRKTVSRHRDDSPFLISPNKHS